MHKGSNTGKFDLQLLAVGFTILAGMVAVITYIERRKFNMAQEKNALLETQIKELTLEKLKKQG